MLGYMLHFGPKWTAAIFSSCFVQKWVISLYLFLPGSIFSVSNIHTCNVFSNFFQVHLYCFFPFSFISFQLRNVQSKAYLPWAFGVGEAAWEVWAHLTLDRMSGHIRSPEQSQTACFTPRIMSQKSISCIETLLFKHACAMSSNLQPERIIALLAITSC